ncbi:uncharacterized protein LOC115308734 [Ixodes scapularis]|uniref:uncharacterized protein LOC115308734 n=1 Tax=Ixodes scapularis TaxID=6945 RepID=UPI001A9DCA2F|nr:uncharacterized protein LOC115308734 [Ixodes scapularis]
MLFFKLHLHITPSGDQRTEVHKHPYCPEVTRQVFKTINQRNHWFKILSQYCQRKPPEIPQPVMGTFGLYPRNCTICCITYNSSGIFYTLKDAHYRTPCSHRMRCDRHGNCVNADLNDLPTKLPAPLAKLVNITLENLWTG